MKSRNSQLLFMKSFKLLPETLSDVAYDNEFLNYMQDSN